MSIPFPQGFVEGRIKCKYFDKAFKFDYTDNITPELIEKSFVELGKTLAIQFKIETESSEERK